MYQSLLSNEDDRAIFENYLQQLSDRLVELEAKLEEVLNTVIK